MLDKALNLQLFSRTGPPDNNKSLFLLVCHILFVIILGSINLNIRTKFIFVDALSVS